MPIRIRWEDKSKHRAQMTETEGVIAILPDEPAACHTGRKAKFRILCGSI